MAPDGTINKDKGSLAIHFVRATSVGIVTYAVVP
jgi:hypothetical protein